MTETAAIAADYTLHPSELASTLALLVEAPNLRRERQAEGIAAAKQRGAYRGRTPRIDMEAITHRLDMGLSPTAIARELGVSRGTVYKAKANMTHAA